MVTYSQLTENKTLNSEISGSYHAPVPTVQL